jgi:NAD(P)H-hydrate repair Nnr-like enzyme with NAD(P)H-hydrate dehydratase domain
VVGMRAQGAPAFEAAVAAAWIHASAGMKAAAAHGNTASVLAGDVLQHVVEALADNRGIKFGYRRGSPPSAARE